MGGGGEGRISKSSQRNIQAFVLAYHKGPKQSKTKTKTTTKKDIVYEIIPPVMFNTFNIRRVYLRKSERNGS